MISIIIPVYNVASYLPKCIDSVLTQSCTDFEAICVNDVSMDYCIADGVLAKLLKTNKVLE